MCNRLTYVRCFDSNCTGWTENREVNLMYLKQQQTYFNDLLKVRGYVFLRDIYEALGFPISKESIVCGWLYDLQNAIGDNFIDFRIDELEDGPNFLLDFNVDGNIIDRL